MSENTKSSDSKLDSVKWLLVTGLVVAGIYGNSYFAAESVLYRVIGLVLVAGLAGFIASKTAKGSAFLSLCVEARTEIRKVVWPTRTETTHTTLIVVVVVLVLAVILWILDSSLSWVITRIIG